MSNNFDDSLRRKWEEKHFPVDDQHRKDMITLIEANRRRRIGVFWWLGGLFLTAAIGGMLFFGLKESRTAAISQPASGVEYKSSPLAQSANTISTDVNQEPAGIKNQLAENPGKPIEKSKAEKRENSSFAPETHRDQKVITKKANVKNKPNSNNTFKRNNIDKKYSNKNKPNSVPVSEKTKVFANAPNASQTDEIRINNPSPLVISDVVAVTILPDDAVIDQATMQPVVKKVKLPAQLESIFFSEIVNESRNSISVQPSSKFHSINLFAEVGTGYIPGKLNEYLSGWTYAAGGGLGYKVGSNTSILVSAGYLLQNKGFEFERTSAVVQTDFGIRSDFNVLHPDKLHFVYSNIGFQYILKRNLFSIFAGMQWLYGAQGTIVVKSVNQFAQDAEISRYSWLSTNGMRHLLLNAEASYGYRITPRLSVNAGLKYAFSSIDQRDPTLSSEGYYWKGRYGSFAPSLNFKYHVYGKR
ncbi:MAG: hypothetical protein ABIQ02_09410 [Saprospiraceae bacterium]